MPTPKRGARLGSNPAHQKLMMSNLASDLFVHGRIKTTEAKAKFLRPYAEKLITKAKRGDLHSRRQVLSDLRDRDVVAYLFEEVAPRFSERDGGYTRILKLAPRKGDNAKMALIELVERGDQGEGQDFVEEGRAQRARGLFGRMRRRRDEDVAPGWTDEHDHDGHDHGDHDHDGHASVESASSPDSVSSVDSPSSAEDVADDQPVVEDDTATTTPDDPTVGDPVEGTTDEADAGGAGGKDAGN